MDWSLSFFSHHCTLFARLQRLSNPEKGDWKLETLPDDHNLPLLSQALSLLNSLWSEKASSLCLRGRQNHSCGGNIKIRCVLFALAVSVDARKFYDH